MRLLLIILQAFHNDIIYPKYLLLTLGWYREDWWTFEYNEQLNCSEADREAVLENSLAFLNFDFLDEKNDVNLTTDTGIVSSYN